MKRLSQEEFSNRIHIYNGADYELVENSYIGASKPVKIKHSTCGHIYEVTQALNIYSENSGLCPYCVEHFEYVDSKFPELAKHFRNQNETHIPKSSKKIVDLICPYCNQVVKSSVVGYIKRGYVPCTLCSDGFSYPEKFVANVLSQLGITYEHEYRPKWARPFRFDFYFLYDGKKYIIETDGGLGHGHNKTANRSIEDAIRIDKEKDNLAYAQGITLVRIDCNYGSNRYEYVKSEVYKGLSPILPMSTINWELCNKRALGSLFRETISIYQNETRYVYEIAEKLNIKPRTVIKYLTEAMDYGLIPKEVMWKKRKITNVQLPIISLSAKHASNELIYCYEDVLLFKSITDVALYYGYNRTSLSAALNNNSGYYKGRHFIRYNELPSDFDFKRKVFPPDEYNNSSSKKMYCQYDMNGNLVHVYVRKECLPKDYFLTNIWRAYNGRSSAYGYKWAILDKKDEFELFEHVKSNELARQFYCS